MKFGILTSGKITKMLRKFNTGVQKKHLIFAILIVLPLVILEIWSVNRLSTLGVEIRKLEQTKTALDLENKVLGNEIAKRSSLQRIEQAGKLLGFEKVKSMQKVEPMDLASNR